MILKNSVFFCIISEIQAISTFDKLRNFAVKQSRKDRDLTVDYDDKIKNSSAGERRKRRLEKAGFDFSRFYYIEEN